MKIKTIYIISLFIIIYIFLIISFNLNKDIKQNEIISFDRIDFKGTKNFTKIQISINNIYDDPHNFTINFYANNSFINSDTVYLEPGNKYGNSRVFRINDNMNASFELIIDNQTEPFDIIKFDFNEQK